MTDDIEVALGSLRWLVTIAKRVQTPNGTSIAETPTDPIQVHADIQPIGALTFWGAQQVDTPVTHRVRLRWLDYLDNTYAITRDVVLANGAIRKETFRIRRMKELNGRKRFIEIEAELEKTG